MKAIVIAAALFLAATGALSQKTVLRFSTAEAVAQKMGIVILATTYLGTRQVSLRAVRDVKAPQDLAGVKMRMPAGPEWLLLGQAIGVTPTPMAMPEVYLALQTGSIDGQEN